MTINAKDKIVLISDLRLQTIEIKENGEPLFDLSNQSLIQFGKPPHFKNNREYTLVRTTIYRKLLQAQSFLPSNLKLCLYEGYRRSLLQQELFNNRYHYIASLPRHKKLSRKSIFFKTTVLVSPVYNIDGSRNIPPHSTGGAVDVYLINQDHKTIDMGIGLDEQHETRQELAKTNSSIISREAVYYRSIMSSALSCAGFINYATEYWHWSYGDRYWAYHTNHKHAIYGEIE